MSNETCSSLLAQPLWGIVAFIAGLTFIYSMIFQWNPWRALYFVAATTFTNGNIGDIIPEVRTESQSLVKYDSTTFAFSSEFYIQCYYSLFLSKSYIF